MNEWQPLRKAIGLTDMKKAAPTKTSHASPSTLSVRSYTHKPQHTDRCACGYRLRRFYSEITQRETGKHCFLPSLPSRYWEPPPPTVYVLSLPRAQSMTHQRTEGFPRLWSNTERNSMHRQSDYYEFIISIFLSETYLSYSWSKAIIWVDSAAVLLVRF